MSWCVYRLLVRACAVRFGRQGFVVHNFRTAELKRSNRIQQRVRNINGLEKMQMQYLNKGLTLAVIDTPYVIWHDDSFSGFSTY